MSTMKYMNLWEEIWALDTITNRFNQINFDIRKQFLVVEFAEHEIQSH